MNNLHFLTSFYSIFGQWTRAVVLHLSQFYDVHPVLGMALLSANQNPEMCASITLNRIEFIQLQMYSVTFPISLKDTRCLSKKIIQRAWGEQWCSYPPQTNASNVLKIRRRAIKWLLPIMKHPKFRSLILFAYYNNSQNDNNMLHHQEGKNDEQLKG